MPALDFAALRLHNQLLTNQRFARPEEVVRWLVAVQAQDVYGAFWALGQRLPSSSEAAVAAALDQGRILRTHLLRPTWHFVHPEDIRWLLALTGPRVQRVNGYIHRREGLDEGIFRRSRKVLEKALADQHYLSREDLGARLAAAGLPAEGLALAYIMMDAELVGLVASGPRRGKQFTYALLDEVAPSKSAPIDLDQALSQFVYRYFASRGPATEQDLAHWSGLTLTQVRRGLEAISFKLDHRDQGEQRYWFVDQGTPPAQPATLFLLPNYDEYGAAYKKLDEMRHPELKESDLWDYSFSHLMVLNGLILGSWRRALGANEVEVQLRPVRPLRKAETKLLGEAIERYEGFLERPVRLG
jgi:hypothetical protein